ncbi:MAG TPA: L-serine ammonia-lyase [Streptosporangiaceae bacterium]|jgi:L-serine dehydratase|nr:L-serine ammonia-lyase [Streptosporangiaceae bacterium]
MTISVFDLFKIGIGPSSSHTVGPMTAARTFALSLRDDGLLPRVASVRVVLYGSLGLTGKGHGSDKAVLLGLGGDTPAAVDVDGIPARLAAIRETGRVSLLGEHEITFDPATDLDFERKRSLPHHPNGMSFAAADATGAELAARIYYSVGGGFVLDESAVGADRIKPDDRGLPHPFVSGVGLLELTGRTGLPISGLMLANETAWRPAAQTRSGLLERWQVMEECVRRGCATAGILPGGLKVGRRAPAVHAQLTGSGQSDPLHAMDWLTLYALAVSEENAAGGRVVTAPTNGAAGIIPAVLHYYRDFVAGSDADGVVRFLLTAGAIGILFKENASISGAEVGCQGEVGSACSMAAAGLTEVLGGTPAQVENAAEIAMEHHLGLTCDPIGGLVQVPCIERNAMASVQAITASRMALRGDGGHFVSLDKVIKTMRDTGRDMHAKYKETSRGGLAVNVIEC